MRANGKYASTRAIRFPARLNLEAIRNEHDGAPVASARKLRHQRAELAQESDRHGPVEFGDLPRLLRGPLQAGAHFDL